jgi:hypothetical protein
LGNDLVERRTDGKKVCATKQSGDAERDLLTVGGTHLRLGEVLVGIKQPEETLPEPQL